MRGLIKDNYSARLYFLAVDNLNLLWWDGTNLDNIHNAIPGSAG